MPIGYFGGREENGTSGREVHYSTLSQRQRESTTSIHIRKKEDGTAGRLAESRGELRVCASVRRPVGRWTARRWLGSTGGRAASPARLLARLSGENHGGPVPRTHSMNFACLTGRGGEAGSLLPVHSIILRDPGPIHVFG